MIREFQNIRRCVSRLGRGMLAAMFFSVIFATTAGATDESPELLVLRSRSSYALSELSVDYRRDGEVILRTCEDPVAFSSCPRPWKVERRRLTPVEYREIKRLAQAAKLFGGRSTGGQLDFAFRSLEVWGRSRVAILVTSLNDSFSEPGPRKKLLETLIGLEERLSKE